MHGISGLGVRVLRRSSRTCGVSGLRLGGSGFRFRAEGFTGMKSRLRVLRFMKRFRCMSMLPNSFSSCSAESAFTRDFEVYVTKFAPHQALKLIARGKSTFDERVVLHRVGFGV